MKSVNLYEDNAGILYLNVEGDEKVWRVAQPERSRFEDDAQSLSGGYEWLDAAPRSVIEGETGRNL